MFLREFVVTFIGHVFLTVRYLANVISKFFLDLLRSKYFRVWDEDSGEKLFVNLADQRELKSGHSLLLFDFKHILKDIYAFVFFASPEEIWFFQNNFIDRILSS